MKSAPVLLALLVGCSGGSDAPVTPPVALPDASTLPPLSMTPGCNPIGAGGAGACLLPYPSDVFRVVDGSLPSGFRIDIPAAARIKTEEGVVVDLLATHPADGFSHLPPILAHFGVGLSGEGLVFHDAPDASLGPDSPTVLLNAATGERVLHFAEVDPRADEYPDRQALIVRPLVRLADATRYIVAIRRLKGSDGAAIAPPEGFRRLRDAEAAGDPVLQPLLTRYEAEVFPALEAAGVARSELQLAWDFTTETDLHVTGDMLAVRSATLALLSATPPAVKVTKITENTKEQEAHVWRKLDGTMTVPLFLDDTEPGGKLHRDAAGKVAQNGTAEVPFTILVPHSLADGTAAPARVLQFGHGFFGGREEAEGGFVTSFIDQTKMIAMTVDWWGMSKVDREHLINVMIGDLPNLLSYTDRVHQGMANQIALTYAVKAGLKDVPELSVGGKLLFDPAQIYFYGISQGHILGGVYLALAPNIERAALSVGGAGWSLMMFRAGPFVPFLALLHAYVPDPLDQQMLVAQTQTVFDRIDPITYAPHVLSDTYPGGPASRRIAMQIGIGDASVPNLGSHVHARALGLVHLLPAPRPLADFVEKEGPIDGSAMTEFDFGVEAPLPGWFANPPSESGSPVHEGVRRTKAGIAQIDAFFHPDGKIANTCDGPCDPE